MSGSASASKLPDLPALVRRMSDVNQRTYYVDDLPGVLARDFLPFWPETSCFLIHYVVHTYVSC